MVDKKVQDYKVRIFGNEYCLVTNEAEEHINESAQLVDSLMQEVVQGARVDEKKAAVLTALRIASRALKSEAEMRMVLLHKEATDADMREILIQKENSVKALIARLEALTIEIDQELRNHLVKD